MSPLPALKCGCPLKGRLQNLVFVFTSPKKCSRLHLWGRPRSTVQPTFPAWLVLLESPIAPSICPKPNFPHCSDLLPVTPSISGVTVVRSFRVRAVCYLSVPLLALVMLSRVKLHCRAGVIVAIINNNRSGRLSGFYFYPPLQSCAAGVISSMVERTYYNCGSGVKQLAQVHVASGRALDWNFNTTFKFRTSVLLHATCLPLYLFSLLFAWKLPRLLCSMA